MSHCSSSRLTATFKFDRKHECIHHARESTLNIIKYDIPPMTRPQERTKETITVLKNIQLHSDIECQIPIVNTSMYESPFQCKPRMIQWLVCSRVTSRSSSSAKQTIRANRQDAALSREPGLGAGSLKLLGRGDVAGYFAPSSAQFNSCSCLRSGTIGAEESTAAEESRRERTVLAVQVRNSINVELAAQRRLQRPAHAGARDQLAG